MEQHAAFRMSYTNLKARELTCAQMLLHRFDTIMSSGTAFATNAQLTARHIHIILP